MVVIQKKVARTSVRAAQIKRQWDSLERKGVAQRDLDFRAKKFGVASKHLSDSESNSSTCTLGSSSSQTSLSASFDTHDADQFLQWAKALVQPKARFQATQSEEMDLDNDDGSDLFAPLAYSEKCQVCRQSLILIEHSGVLKCVNSQCVANGRRINVVDGDMASLPFGADISYKSMSLARDDLQLCELDRTLHVTRAGEVIESCELLPASTSLFNSLLKGCATSNTGFRCSTGDNPMRVASDGSCTLSCNDAHFKHLCVVFGYSASNKALTPLKSLSVKNPYMESISPSVVLYLQTCLCKTICCPRDGAHSLSECKWRDNGSLNYTELSHLLSRIAKDSNDSDWKKMVKRPSSIANLLSHLIGHVPEAPTESELSQACQYFVVARRAKDEEFSCSHSKPKPFKAGFAWSKIWQMMYPESKTRHFFPMPSNVERLKSLDQWWKRLCDTFGWQYYPTAMPIIASKMAVRLATLEETDERLF